MNDLYEWEDFKLGSACHLLPETEEIGEFEKNFYLGRNKTREHKFIQRDGIWLAVVKHKHFIIDEAWSCELVHDGTKVGNQFQKTFAHANTPTEAVNRFVECIKFLSKEDDFVSGLISLGFTPQK